MSDFDSIERHGATIRNYHDGRIEVENDNILATIDAEGTVSTTIKNTIEKIGLTNILEVKNYRIFREDALTVHAIEFKNGGTVDLRYLETGKLEKFAGKDIVFSIDKEGALAVGQNNKRD